MRGRGLCPLPRAVRAEGRRAGGPLETRGVEAALLPPLAPRAQANQASAEQHQRGGLGDRADRE